ncbi:MAG TPA: TlpA disulfide reductase family protein [bacterium]|jgi:thiol-disulfide isomerase/thioredoxin|nr:TlpA disulfide reductase family protein [bacterium]
MVKRFFVFVFFAISGFSGCGTNGSSGNNVDLIPPGNRVPATEIKATFLNASSGLNLAQTRGKLLVVDYWATWCGPCRMEIPTLVKMYDTYHSKGLELWGLSVEGNDGKPDGYFNKFISDYQIQYPVGLASMDTLKAYGINPIPTTFFIDKSGKIALSFVGVHPEGDFVGAIEKLLAE